MDYLISDTHFTKADTRAFSFQSHKPFNICAISVQRSENGKADFHYKTLNSEEAYGKWIKHCRQGGSLCQPTLLLALHKRLDQEPLDDAFTQSTALPYGRASFMAFCRDLYQHRTLAWLVRRASTAVFYNRFVTWEHSESSRPSMVYHCKSDTASLCDGNDVVLSATYFVDQPLTLAVMYGCTEDTIEDIVFWLGRCSESAFHPLLLPMIFADIERRRFLNAIDSKATELEGRILELERRVKREATQAFPQEETNADGRKTMTGRDCNAIPMCRSMTLLKNGLLSLATELGSMRDHLQTLPNISRNWEASSTSEKRQLQDDGVHIDAKVKAMKAELESKIRDCECHLEAMTLATQMEWNYRTRHDAQVNYGVATAVRNDGSQAKQISLLGMIFLPGTFLATFFSMTFFSWMPEDSAPGASPWLVLYWGLTVLLTSVTILWIKKWSMAKEDERKSVKEDMSRDMDANLFSRLSFRSSFLSDESSDLGTEVWDG